MKFVLSVLLVFGLATALYARPPQNELRCPKCGCCLELSLKPTTPPQMCPMGFEKPMGPRWGNPEGMGLGPRWGKSEMGPRWGNPEGMGPGPRWGKSEMGPRGPGMGHWGRKPEVKPEGKPKPEVKPEKPEGKPKP